MIRQKAPNQGYGGVPWTDLRGVTINTVTAGVCTFGGTNYGRVYAFHIGVDVNALVRGLSGK